MIQAPLKTLLLGLRLHDESTEWTHVDSMQELAQLAKTAGLEVIDSVVQYRETPHPKYYIGQGKLELLKPMILEQGIRLIVTDDELSPSQSKALESELKIKVLDRTGLILDIFAQRARTAEARLQVELAQLEYLLPRLTRLWTHLSRLGGGIGTRGPGETQLEVDKRQIQLRMRTIEKKLEKTQIHRQVLRQRRDNVPILNGAIIGYTNAGKSTLLNTLTKAKVLAEDALFATLDPTTKKITLPNKDQVLITDTVGFIQKLPHQLVKAFRATLEEVGNAHFLIHVVDLSNPKYPVLIQTTQALLKEMNAHRIPQLYVFNKIDQMTEEQLQFINLRKYSPNVFISAQDPACIPEFLQGVSQFLNLDHKTLTLSIPYTHMDTVHLFHEYGRVLEETYEESVFCKVDIHSLIADKILAQAKGITIL